MHYPEGGMLDVEGGDVHTLQAMATSLLDLIDHFDIPDREE